MSTPPAPRRSLRFESFDDILQEAERLVAANAGTTGNWTLGQILEHLATVMEKSIDGFQSRASWPIRLIARTFLRDKVLRDGMKAGFRLPPQAEAELVRPEADPHAALDHLRRAVERLRTECHRAEHPAFGQLAINEWNQLHQRHAELHLSFAQDAGG
jgi:hypothetical protein